MTASTAKPNPYAAKIKKLYNDVHKNVKALLDPKNQKRSFPKKALRNFLRKRKIAILLKSRPPDEITSLVNSVEKLDVVPTEILRTFFDEHEVWNLLPDNIKKAIEGNRDHRVPTQGSSDFIINRELGDWAESVVRAGVDDSNLHLRGVRYGRSDNLLAGEEGFGKLFLEHLAELKEVGKRPDLLIYREADVPNESFEAKKASEIIEAAKKAIGGFEIRSSQQAIKTDDKAEKLSFTPKIEDIHNVVQWITLHGVPHFYVQVLFGRVYAISFEKILELLAGPQEDGAYRVVKVARNQFKSTIYIPLTQGVCISTGFENPSGLAASIKELPNGRVVILVRFRGGKIVIDNSALAKLINVEVSAT